MAERLLNLFAPEYCIACRSVGSALCRTCSLDIAATHPGVCYRCNKLSPDSRTCSSCRSGTPIFSLDWVTEYEGLAKELVKRSKFKSSRSAILTMAASMDGELPIRSVDFVTFVPTATSSVRRRGMDHALLLSRKLALLRGLKHRRLLSRNTQAKQIGAGRIRRKNQLKDAFRPRRKLNGETILLIDDVISTGSSLENSARALKLAGAKRIHAAVFARNTG